MAAPPEQGIDRSGHVVVYGQVLPVLDLDDDVKGGRRFALQHRFLRAPPTGFLVTQRDRLDAAYQIAQSGVLEEIVEGDAVGGADQLHPPFGNRARRSRLQFPADLIDDDHLGHVVLHGLDHHLVLQFGLRHLHTPRPANGRMGNIPVAADLVGGIDHDHAVLFSQDTRCLAQKRGLAHARLAQEQDALSGLEEIPDDVDRSVHRPSHAQGQADDVPAAVANAGNSMQRTLDPSPIVGGELAELSDDVVDLSLSYFALAKDNFSIQEPGFGHPAQIQDDLEQIISVVLCTDCPADLGRQDRQQGIQIVGYVVLHPLLNIGPVHRRAGLSWPALADEARNSQDSRAAARRPSGDWSSRSPLMR